MEEIPVLASIDPEQSVRLTLYGGELILPSNTFKLINSHQNTETTQATSTIIEIESGTDGTGISTGTGAGDTLYKALTPPPDSYASDRQNEVGIFFIQLKPGAHFTLPPAKGMSVRSICLSNYI